MLTSTGRRDFFQKICGARMLDTLFRVSCSNEGGIVRTLTAVNVRCAYAATGAEAARCGSRRCSRAGTTCAQKFNNGLMGRCRSCRSRRRSVTRVIRTGRVLVLSTHVPNTYNGVPMSLRVPRPHALSMECMSVRTVFNESEYQYIRVAKMACQASVQNRAV